MRDDKEKRWRREKMRQRRLGRREEKNNKNDLRRKKIGEKNEEGRRLRKGKIK